jgi:hypothetical protein
LPAFNPRKTASLRPLGKVDVAALREEVLAIPEPIWDFENSSKPNDYRALDRTRHILFRFVDTTRDWRRSHDRPLWEAWRARIEPILRRAVAPYGYANGVFPRVMLARMPPGGDNNPHQHTNVAARWPQKNHVPITTNDRVAFWIDGRAYHLPVGEVFEVNNMAVHAVRNDGDTDRIHLIFEYYDADQPDPDWVS